MRGESGIEEQLGTFFRSNLLVAYALRDGAYTQHGTWRLQVRLTANY
jgi:hypothetical protein